MATSMQKIMADYQIWWDNEGSGMIPAAKEDTHEFVNRVSKIAWSNGSYKTSENAYSPDKVAIEEKELEDMAKTYAIGSFTSNGENEDDYEKFISLKSLKDSEFEIWEPLENYPLQYLQEVIEAEYNSALSLAKRANELNIATMAYLVYQYDLHFTESSKVLFGIFPNKTYNEAKEIAMNGFEKLYPGFKDDVCRNGTGQWTTDNFDFGFSIKRESLNRFEEC